MNEKEWEEQPLYMSCKDICKLGFSKPTVYRWFRAVDFPPMIKDSGYRVNKNKLKTWLEKKEECINESL